MWCYSRVVNGADSAKTRVLAKSAGYTTKTLPLQKRLLHGASDSQARLANPRTPA